MDCWPKHSEASGIHCRGWFDNRLRKLDRCATTTWETTHRKQVRVPSKGPSHWLRMLLQPQSLERICHNLSINTRSITDLQVHKEYQISGYGCSSVSKSLLLDWSFWGVQRTDTRFRQEEHRLHNQSCCYAVGLFRELDHRLLEQEQ